MLLYLFGRIILEHHTYCNRQCKWCLYKYMENKSINYMDKDMLNTILNEVYDNIDLFKTDKLTFSLFRYNEPLYDIDNLISVSKTIKDFFNKKNIETYIYIHTNGDYLCNSTFEKVMEYIDEITINNYKNNSILDILDIVEKLNKDIKLEKIHENKERRTRLYFSYKHKSVTFFVNSEKDLAKTSRGGIINKYVEKDDGKWVNDLVERDYQCDLLGRVLVIDYDGTINACCETSSRIAEHKDMMLGNIKEGLNNIIPRYKTIDVLTNKSCKFCHMSSKICGFVDDNNSY